MRAPARRPRAGALRGDAPPAGGPRRALAARARRALGRADRSRRRAHRALPRATRSGDAGAVQRRAVAPALRRPGGGQPDACCAQAPPGLLASDALARARGAARAPSPRRTPSASSAAASRAAPSTATAICISSTCGTSATTRSRSRSIASSSPRRCAASTPPPRSPSRRWTCATAAPRPLAERFLRSLRARARRLRSLRGRRLLRELPRRRAREGRVDRGRGCGDRCRAARARRRERAAPSRSRACRCSRRAEAGRSCSSAGSSGPARAPRRRSSPTPLGGVVIASDRVRKRLAGLAPTARAARARRRALRSRAAASASYAGLLERAAPVLDVGPDRAARRHLVARGRPRARPGLRASARRARASSSRRAAPPPSPSSAWPGAKPRARTPPTRGRRSTRAASRASSRRQEWPAAALRVVHTDRADWRRELRALAADLFELDERRGRRASLPRRQAAACRALPHLRLASARRGVAERVAASGGWHRSCTSSR